jgi:hypothetical protein
MLDLGIVFKRRLTMIYWFVILANFAVIIFELLSYINKWHYDIINLILFSSICLLEVVFLYLNKTLKKEEAKDVKMFVWLNIVFVFKYIFHFIYNGVSC